MFLLYLLLRKDREREGKCSVDQTRRFHFSYIYSVFLSTRFSQTATVLDKDQEREHLRESGECSDDKGVLETHVGDPWRDATTFFSMWGIGNTEKE